MCTDSGDDDNVLHAKSTIVSLREDFKQLALSMKSSLKRKEQENELTLDAFRDDLMFDAPEPYRDQLQLYFEKMDQKIFEARSYDEVFIVFNDCWDYLNPYLLEHLVIKYGAEELRARMDAYLDNLGSFMSETELRTYWRAAQDARACRRRRLTNRPEGVREVITQHELTPTSKLQYIEDIRIEYMEKMRLSRFALFIAHFEEHCLVIVWHVSAYVAEKFATMFREKAASLTAVKILDGKCVICVRILILGCPLNSLGDHSSLLYICCEYHNLANIHYYFIFESVS